MIKIKVNHKEYLIQKNTNLKQFLISHQFSIDVIVCVMNGEIIKKTNYDFLILQQGNELNFFQMIGGG